MKRLGGRSRQCSSTPRPGRQVYARSRPPFVLQKELGDFCVTYEINVFTETAEGMETRYTQLHQNILDIFNEYGVQIMTPSYESDPQRTEGRAEGPVVRSLRRCLRNRPSCRTLC